MENRRDFLRRTALLTAIMPLVVNCQSTPANENPDILSLIKKNADHDPNSNWTGAKEAPANVSWKTVLSADSDEGEKIRISGTIYQPDGKTAAPNVLVYAYHTNIEGYYGRGHGEPPHGRHRGWMLTDADGRYEFDSIKPAPYPGRDTPAHIHFTLTSLTLKEDWIDDIWFAGDRLITPEIKRKQMIGKGGFDSILKLEKDANGIWHGRRDIRLWKA